MKTKVLLIIALIFSLFPLASNSFATTNLLGHWTMDEPSGNTFMDQSGNGNHALAEQTVQRDEGYVGTSAFAATTAQNPATAIESASLNQIQTSQSFTFAFWMKAEPTDQRQLILRKGQDIQISRDADHGFHVDMFGSYHHFGFVFESGRWQHIAFTLKNKQLILYVNGSKKGERTFTGTFQGAGELSFGHVYNGKTTTVLDDLRLYSNVITAQALQELAAYVKPETTPPQTPHTIYLKGFNHQAVNLAWDAATDNLGIKGYHVMRNAVPVLFTTETALTVAGLTPDTNYMFTVVAEDLAGNRSTPSAQLVVRTNASFQKQKNAVGVNMSKLQDWTPELPFIDVFKKARPWSNWNHPNYVFDLDTQGNIRSLPDGMEAFTMTMIDLDDHYPKGDYLILYDGEGSLSVWEDQAIQVKSQAPGKILVSVSEGGNGLWFTLKNVNPNNYIRNIRAYMPGFHNGNQATSTQTFHPQFLQRWNDFRVLRFMDWMIDTEESKLGWAKRTTPQSFSQAGPEGVAVEHMVELANALQSDPWFTLPTRADDQYITQFATYVRDHLDSNLKAYIEWSNETWNSSFSFQNGYAIEQGKALGYTGSDDQIQAKFHAHRAKQMFQIWENVFGSDQRFVKVLGGFHHGGAELLDLMAQHENVHQMADAYAIAPYFGHDYGGAKAEWVKTATKADIFADLQNEIRMSSEATQVVAQALKKYPTMQLIAYEGGQHFVGTFFDGKWYPDDQVLTDKLIFLNRQPEMYAIYQQDLENWKKAGGTIYVAYNSVTSYSKWGSWGLFETYDQPASTAPKYNAISDWLKTNPIWWETLDFKTKNNPAKYRVIYDGNQKMLGTVPLDLTNYAPGASITVLENSGELQRVGFIFNGWNTQADGKGQSYAPGSTLTMGEQEITLYAQWKDDPRFDECFIATAAYGSKFEPSVRLLRQFRDDFLLTNSLGRSFVDFYYQHSPPIAQWIAGDEALKQTVRIMLVPFILLAYLFLHPWLLVFISIIIFIGYRKLRRSAI